MSSHESDNKKPSPRGRGRGRGRPPGRGAAKRGRKKAIQYVTKENNENKDNVVMDENELNRNDTVSLSPKFDETTDSITPSSISFVTSSYDVISRPLHKNEPLNWKYKVNLIGEKVVNPRIHCCDNCVLPILVYGRMIPCKHVFCLSCAKQSEKICIRCTDKVIRVEKSGLGTVFMCQTESCKRTYLSQRDLQAHIQHRHMRRTLPLAAHSPVNTSMTNANVNQQSPRVSYSGNSSGSFQSPIPVVSSRSNLITVPIQEEVSGNMNQMSQNVAQQTQMMVTNQQINNYPPQPPPYSHHSSHMQWPPMGNAPPGFTPYRPSWPPMPMQQGPPYNPYNRPYFPQ